MALVFVWTCMGKPTVHVRSVTPHPISETGFLTEPGHQLGQLTNELWGSRCLLLSSLSSLLQQPLLGIKRGSLRAVYQPSQFSLLSYLFIEIECVSSDCVQCSQRYSAASMALSTGTPYFRWFRDCRKGAAPEMAQEVKALVPKPDGLCSIPRTDSLKMSSKDLQAWTYPWGPHIHK